MYLSDAYLLLSSAYQTRSLFFFRDSVEAVLSVIVQHSWIMKSTENRCAFVRAEYVQILLLLLQCIGSYNGMPKLDSEAGSHVSEAVSDIAVDDSDTMEHFIGSDLRCLDGALNSEMQLILESDALDRQCKTEVRTFTLY